MSQVGALGRVIRVLSRQLGIGVLRQSNSRNARTDLCRRLIKIDDPDRLSIDQPGGASDHALAAAIAVTCLPAHEGLSVGWSAMTTGCWAMRLR